MFKPNYRLKIDYGSRYTGIAIIKNDSEVIFMMQLHHRTDVKETWIEDVHSDVVGETEKQDTENQGF